MTWSFYNPDLPKYLLDRLLIINKFHEHKINSFIVSRASSYIRQRIYDLRKAEYANYVESRPKEETFSIDQIPMNELILNPLELITPHVTGLQLILSMLHSKRDGEKNLKLSRFIENDLIFEIFHASLQFDFYEFQNLFTETLIREFSPDNIIKFFNFVNIYPDKYPFLESKVYDYIHTQIHELILSKEFLQISPESLLKILASDQLNLRREVDAIKIIDFWIAANEEDRLVYAKTLLCGIRFGIMNRRDLLQIANNRFILKKMNECYPHLMRADELRQALKMGSPVEFNYMCKPRLPHEIIMVLGGWEGSQEDSFFGPSQAMQIFNPNLRVWKRISNPGDSNLFQGHAYSDCVFYEDSIYLIGGFISGSSSRFVYRYQIRKNTWRMMTSMHEKRNYVTCCLLNGQIYAIGGHNGHVRLNSVEVYDPKKNLWSFSADMNRPRSDSGSCAINNEIYVVGGFDGSNFHNSCEVYNETTNQWTLIEPMLNCRSGVNCIAYNGSIYVVGGNDGLQRLRSMECYDPERKTWKVMPNMISKRSNFTSVVLFDDLYVFGGWNDDAGSTISSVEKINLASNKNKWEPLPPLKYPASANCACVIRGLEMTKYLFSTYHN